MSAAGVLVVVGLLLCLAGALSVRLAVLAAGFGAAWIIAEVFGASLLTGLLVGLAGAVAGFVLTLLLAHVVMFFTGCVLGSVLGAKLFVLLAGPDPSWVLALVFVPAVAVVCGYLGSRYQHAFLVWATAFAGAAVVLSGLALLGRDSERLFRSPETVGDSAVLTIAWIALGLAGRAVQRRLGRRHRDDEKDGEG